MRDKKRVDVWYSLQSDYCYFLLDRLLMHQASNVEIVQRPDLGLVLRMPEATRHRSGMEQQYFYTDSERTAAFLGLPFSRPNPSPIQLKTGSVWIAREEQPLNERLNRLFVGANSHDRGLAFLDVVVRGLWDGSNVDWDKGAFLPDAMSKIGLDHDDVLTETTWTAAKSELDGNHEKMLETGHWGVPLMSYLGEPFYGQDRFDQLIWRMSIGQEYRLG